MGVDMAKRDELIAGRMDVNQIAEHLGVDSLGYLSHEGLCDSVGATDETHCQACFSGRYPVKVDDAVGKRVFEK